MANNTILPSFIELMASLGLDNKPSGPGVAPSPSHSRSASMASRSSSSLPPLHHLSDSLANVTGLQRSASPAIVVSHHDTESSRPNSRASDQGGSRTSSRRTSVSTSGQSTARYNPYAAITGRRGSMPTINPEKEAKVRHGRFRSLSIPHSVSASVNSRAPPVPRMRKSQHLANADFADFIVPAPISSLARHQRRRSSSPTSPIVSSDRNNNNIFSSAPSPPTFSLTPVSIPTLSVVFPKINEDFVFPGPTDTEEPETNLRAAAAKARRQRSASPLDRHYTGVRISTARYSSPEHSQLRRHVGPVA